MVNGPSQDQTASQARSLPFRPPNLYRTERRDLRYAEAVVACRRIRSFGRSSLPPRGWRNLHLDWEIEALLALKDPAAAWRQYRLWLRYHPKRIPVRTLEQRARNAPDLVCFDEAPIRYAAGRWDEGRRALEAYLGAALARPHVTGYDLLFNVYNEDAPEPTNRCRVTLWHFYSKLGKRLDEWEQWRTWVPSLHPRLFRATGVRQKDLLKSSDVLADFYGRLMKERERRSQSSGVTFGQADLVDDVRKVRKRHEAVRRRRDRWEKRSNSLRDELNSKLEKYFPFVLCG